MKRRVKGMFVVGLFLVSASAIAAIDAKYDSDYAFKSSLVNTGDSEFAMSPYQDGKIAYLKKENGKTNVYVVSVGDKGDFVNVQKDEALSKLGIEGTFAYDQSANKIYFTKTKKSVSRLYEAKYIKDKWKKVKEVKMEEDEIIREANSFMVNAGWNYKDTPMAFNIFNPTMEGTRIYFTSPDREGGFGGNDIWYTNNNGKKWSKPENAGKGINTPGSEDYAFVDGNKLYFAKKDESSNLYVSELNGNIWGDAESMGEQYNSNSDDYNLIVVGGAPFITSLRNGSELDNLYYMHKVKIVKQDSVPEDTIDEPVEPIQPWHQFKYVLFQFDYDKNDFKEEYRQDINDLIASMKNYPNAKFCITGHTDDRGSDAYNDKLSKRRAEAVKAELVKAGFAPSRLVTVGKGKRELKIVNAQTEEEHYQNRRVEVTIINNNNELEKVPVYNK